MAKIIINDKYVIDNVYVNDHYVMTECYVKAPTDEEIRTIAIYEEKLGEITLFDNGNSYTTKGKFKEIDINPHTGGIDFLIESKDNYIVKGYY
jgi:hypothetical protein